MPSPLNHEERALARGVYRVAVVGATGAVGRMVLTVLEERGFPVAELVPFASERSQGVRVPFGGREHDCRVLGEEALGRFDLVFCAAGGSVSGEWAPKLAGAGATVIDKSSRWRMVDGVPLVAAGVNDEVLDQVRSGPHPGIVASPNCSTMQMVVALKPILDAAGIEEIVVSTYQSVSGTGRRAIAELEEQSRAVLQGGAVERDVYPHQIAFNALPQVEEFDPGDGGFTTEETKMMRETRKILGLDGELPITATCVRVPVMRAHSESIRVRTREPLSADECRELLRGVDGITVVDDPQRRAYPLATEAAGKDDVFVGRIRNDLGPGGERRLNLWVVGDNLRAGAATNAVQIAEALHRRGLTQPAGAGSPKPEPVGAAG